MRPEERAFALLVRLNDTDISTFDEIQFSTLGAYSIVCLLLV